MSPRPAPSRSDATAEKFLSAAASLIDAALAEPGTDIPARLRALHFPAALEWMRTEDVLRAASERDDTASRKAFRNRWPVKDDFVSDAIVHALLYRDVGGESAPQTFAVLDSAWNGSGTVCERLRIVTDAIEIELYEHPRTWLLAHVAPLLGHHPEVAAPVIEAARADQDMWVLFIQRALDDTGAALRPGWTDERIQMALQAILDGVLLRRRIDPERFHDTLWASANVYTDVTLAFLCGVVDFDRSGLSTADWVDRAASSWTRTDGD